MFKSYDFYCQNCDHTFEDLADEEEIIVCDLCQQPAEKLLTQ